MSIPKIVHYCWFGGNDYPENIKQYIDTWEKKLPNYKFMLWNEEAFDYKKIRFTKEAYEEKKYAFVSDYVRLYALKKYGGIYLDTDMEMIKNIDDLLNDDLILGYEEEDGSSLCTCFIASKPNHVFIDEIMSHYENRSFKKEDGSFDIRPNNLIFREKLIQKYNPNLDGKEQYLQDGIHVYPYDYFNPMSLITGKIKETSNTRAIHWHTLSWVSWKVKVVKFIRLKIFIPIFGEKIYKHIEKFRKR